MSLETGTSLGPYEIVARVGAGAMGEVYRARDTRLGRTVAIKILQRAVGDDRASRERFEREARAASSLNHPHICTVFDVGRDGEVDFLVMEFLDGQTLAERVAAGPLPVEEAVTRGIEIAGALKSAHRHHLVHRDLKPSNVMVTDTGAKLLDFGLVKRTPDPAGPALADATRALEVTQPGIVVGTVSYMSPEQARGQEVDGRTDLFSLGVVLYELVTGRKPFGGQTAADVVSAILSADPTPPGSVREGVPADVEAVILKALRKDPALRYQSAGDLLEDLRAARRALTRPDESGSTASRTATGRPKRARRTRRRLDSLAVLPLANASADPAAEYLSDGVTESIINSLSAIPKLRVMARSTVFRYKGQVVDPGRVAEELDVRAILMGTVRQVGESLVIGVELIDAADGSQLWGAQYSRRPDDILSVQDDIASRISETLKIRLTGDQKKRFRTARQAVDGEAYRAYLQGRFCLNRRSEEQLERAVQYFEAAIARAPDYAPAWAGLADACALRTGGGTLDTDSQPIIDRARTSAAKALALDPDLADAHASMAFVKFRLDWDWRAAEGEFSKALVLNPGHAPTRHWHGMFLAARGRFDEALDEMRRAAELDPMSLIVMAGIAKVLYFAGRYDEAVEQDQKIIQLDPTFMNAWFDMGFALLVGGRHDEAMEVFKKIPVFTERLGGEAMELPWFHAVIGDLDRARASLARLQAHGAPEHISPAEYAFTYAVLGEGEESHRWLTQACEQRSGLLTYMHVDPLLRELITYPPRAGRCSIGTA